MLGGLRNNISEHKAYLPERLKLQKEPNEVNALDLWAIEQTTDRQASELKDRIQRSFQRKRRTKFFKKERKNSTRTI